MALAAAATLNVETLNMKIENISPSPGAPAGSLQSELVAGCCRE